jgi:precorrin-2 dehydrogenase/sirohydrochlorin ferrochelatase
MPGHKLELPYVLEDTIPMGTMKYYPMFVRLTGRRCLVVGGGALAAGKARSLIDAGAQVTVISPCLCDELQKLAETGRITHEKRSYESADAGGYFLAFSAAGDDAIDERVAADAEAAGVLVNVVDRTSLCDFIAPAVVRRDDLVIAISTSGASPALAKRLRRQLEDELGPEYALALQLLGRLRARLKDTATPSSERARIFAKLVDSPLLDLLRQRRFDEVDALLAAAAGEQVSLGSLAIDWSRG